MLCLLLMLAAEEFFLWVEGLSGRSATSSTVSARLERLGGSAWRSSVPEVS